MNAAVTAVNGLCSEVKPEKERYPYQKATKLSLLVNDMIVHVQTPMEFTKEHPDK